MFSADGVVVTEPLLNIGADFGERSELIEFWIGSSLTHIEKLTLLP
jgi:hypothetical protein